MAAPPHTRAEFVAFTMIVVVCCAAAWVAIREHRTPTAMPSASPSLSISEPDPTADCLVTVNEDFTEFIFGADSCVGRICVAAGCRSLDEINAWIQGSRVTAKRVD